ncbi:DrmE family protein [Shimazuella sp. AN120528]|uniref:DrmE family protein n=1 Tax=Shimazuella soli TaxID=1892854 RepID=UPI001F10232D|nr:DrmE family protein [Shimazuella soli]MCH5586366.1 DrmE family protein [Shimazuella soli]
MSTKKNFFDRFQKKLIIDDAYKSIDPLIIKISRFIYQAFQKENQRLIFLVPPQVKELIQYSSLIAQWAQKRKLNRKVSLENLSFPIDQKLLLNEFVVSFEGKELEGNQIIVKTKSGRNNYLKHYIPFEKIYRLWPVDTERPLSRHSRISRSIRNIHQAVPNQSFSNQKILMVTQLRQLPEIGNKIRLQRKQWVQDVIAGKIDVNGELVSLDSMFRFQETPHCVFASDIYRLISFLEDQSEEIQGVILDGAQHLQSMQLVDEYLLDKNINTVVFLEQSHRDILKQLKNRDFRIYNTHTFPEANQLSNHWQFSLKYGAFREQVMSNHFLDWQEISQLSRVCFQFTKENMRISEPIQILFQELFFSVLKLSRLARIVSSEEHEKQLDLARNWLERITKLKPWFDPVTYQHFQNLLRTHIHVLENQPEIIPKVAVLKQILEKDFSHKILLLTTNKEEANKLQYFWRELGYYQLEAKTVKQSLNSSTIYDRIIFVGWIGQKSIRHVLHSSNSKQYHFLLYEHEREWYQNFNAKWQVERNRLLGNVSSTVIETNSKNTLVDPYKLETNFILQKYKRNKALIPSKQTSLSIRNTVALIEFQDPCFGFFDNQYDFLVLESNDNQIFKESKIFKLEELQEGDFLLFFRPLSDYLKQFVVDNLKRQGEDHLVDMAKLWRDALLQKYEEYRGDLSRLYNLLVRHGCTRKNATIRNWVKTDMIGPNDPRDLEIIAEATNYDPLLENLDEVKEAIHQIRSAHLQAGAAIQKNIIGELNQGLSQMQWSPDQSVPIFIENYEVELVQIHRILPLQDKFRAKLVNQLQRWEQ